MTPEEKAIQIKESAAAILECENTQKIEVLSFAIVDSIVKNSLKPENEIYWLQVTNAIK
jgi:hypothetical protein